MYPRGKQGTFHPSVKGFLIALYAFIFLSFMAEALEIHDNKNWGMFMVSGYCKAMITAVKYIP